MNRHIFYLDCTDLCHNIKLFVSDNTGDLHYVVLVYIQTWEIIYVHATCIVHVHRYIQTDIQLVAMIHQNSYLAYVIIIHVHVHVDTAMQYLSSELQLRDTM